MTTTEHPPTTAQARRGWGPAWAKVVAWAALVPAALVLFLGVGFFIQGFGDDALAAVGFFVGPILAILALAVALPAVLFLVRRGKPLFITSMCTTGLLLLIAIFYGF